MADVSREEKLKAARETFKQLQKKKAGSKPAATKAKKIGDDDLKELVAEPSTASVEAPSSRVSTEDSPATSPPAPSAKPDDSTTQDLQREVQSRDASIASLKDELSALKAQEEKYKRDLSQHSTSSLTREKEIAALKTSDSEKDSTISSLQLELGQLQNQLTALKESSTSAPTPEQLQSLTNERDALKQQLSTTQTTLDKTQSELQKLRNSYTALENDTKTTHETLVSLRGEHSKLKETHSLEIQKSRTSHSRAAELQIENRTLLSRVDELKQKVVSLTAEKLDLVNRSETLEKDLYNARKVQSAAIAAGEAGTRGSVELNTELDALIQGQEKRATIRETNQRRYSQFVGQSGEDGESMREINERRLKKAKDSGEFGRERETGFVIDLIASGSGGCGLCTGEVLVL